MVLMLSSTAAARKMGTDYIVLTAKRTDKDHQEEREREEEKMIKEKERHTERFSATYEEGRGVNKSNGGLSNVAGFG